MHDDLRAGVEDRPPDGLRVEPVHHDAVGPQGPDPLELGGRACRADHLVPGPHQHPDERGADRPGGPRHEHPGIVEKSVGNVRQIAARARKHVEARRPRFEASREDRDELVRRFFEAIGAGDMDGLIELLAADAVMYGDSGSKAPAIREPVRGAERVARFLVGLARLGVRQGMTLRYADVNGELGAIAFADEGRVNTVLWPGLTDGRVRAARSIVNPDELQHLGER